VQAELGAGLGVRRDAAGIVVGRAGDQARTERGEWIETPSAYRRVSQGP
jgi:hypothetical protein